MTKYTFTPQPQREWLSVDTAARWLDCPVQHVRNLAQSGQLRFRTSAGVIQIDSASVDKLLEDRPLMGPAPLQTFVKVGGKCFEELPDGRLIPVR